MHDLLDGLYQRLIPVIKDAGNVGDTAGTLPSAAFTAFFKDAARGSTVADMLIRVINGDSVGAADAWSNGAPIFACLTASDKGKMTLTGPDGAPYDVWDLCSAPGRERVTASAATATKWIFVCPLFFASTKPDFPPSPPNAKASASNCPRLTRNQNKFRGFAGNWGGGASLAQVKVWIVLEELLHLYIYDTWKSRKGQGKDEVVDINAAYSLSAADSVFNALNYVYYASSK